MRFLISANVFVAADAMLGLQTHLNEAGVHRGVGGVDGGEAVIDADVVDDDAEIFRPDDFFDQALQIGDFFLGDRELGSRRRLERDHELSGVRLREIGESELAVQAGDSRQRPTKNNTSTVTGTRSTRWTSTSYQSEHPIERRIESRVEARRPSQVCARRLAMLVCRSSDIARRTAAPPSSRRCKTQRAKPPPPAPSPKTETC